MVWEAPCAGGLSGICLLIFFFIFNFQQPSNPILHIFQISQYPLPPPPQFFCIKNIRKIIQKSFLGKLLNQGLQTNRVIFRLNEILARYLRKGTEIGEKKMLLTRLKTNSMSNLDKVVFHKKPHFQCW